jgi:uncharacterized membrane protein
MGAWGGVASLVLGVMGGVIPGLNLLGLVGSILVLVAVFRCAGELRRPDITRSVIISIVLTVVTFIIFFVMVGTAVIAMMASGDHSPGAGLGAGVIVGGLLSWALFIAASWFWYQAMVAISEGSGVPLFKTSGLVYFIGVCTVIVFGLGLIAMLVGQVMQVVAFFNVPDEQTAASSAQPPAL